MMYGERMEVYPELQREGERGIERGRERERGGVLALVCYFNYHLLYFSIFMGIVYTC
jgi:hypothetical protein